MSNNYEGATITPYFPPEVVKAHWSELDELSVGYESDGYLYVEDGCSDWDEFHLLLRKMLKEANMDYCYVEGAFYHDKMRQGEWGGFAHFITQDNIEYVVTGSWCANKAHRFTLKKSNLKDFMPTDEALEIVYNLAKEVAEKKEGSEPNDLHEKYGIALNTVHDFIVNSFGND